MSKLVVYDDDLSSFFWKMLFQNETCTDESIISLGRGLVRELMSHDGFATRDDQIRLETYKPSDRYIINK